MAQLVGIARRDKKRAAMQSLESASVNLEQGVAQDFRGKPGKRQVTVLTAEGWDAACYALNTNLPWTTRRANLLIKELDLEHSVGKILVIGQVQLLITQETDPCERMDETLLGLCDALTLEWRGGVCCRVLRGGEIQLGDIVELINAQ